MTEEVVVPAGVVTVTGFDSGPPRVLAVVRHTMRTDTKYSTTSQGALPIRTLSITSSSRVPRFEPSRVTNVPPSIGPDNG